MIGTTTPNRVLARTFRVLIVLEALSFLCFALLHLGVRIPVGFVVIQEPRRPFAVIVEGLAALLLALAAFAVLTRKTWAWAAVPGRTPSRLRACSGGWWRSLPAAAPTRS